MHTIQCFDFAFTPEDFLLGKHVSEKRADKMRKDAARALEEGQPLLSGRAAIAFYQAGRICDGRVSLVSLDDGSEENLLIGARAGYLAPAEMVAVVVSTIGGEVEALMKRCSEQGDEVMAYYLYELSRKAISFVGTKTRAYVEGKAAEKSWGVGPSMQPGSLVGWGVEGQRDLLRMSRAREIGVDINDSCLLLPFFSGSYLVGMGCEYKDSKIGSLCHECPRYATCDGRRENEASQ